MPKVERIAILGANSQIALDYIELSLKKTERTLYLFSRNPLELGKLVNGKFIAKFKLLEYDNFGDDSYDLVVNFVGGSDPAQISKLGKDIFNITDEYDSLVINYLKTNTKCKYIFISSGAAYGDVFSYEPASNQTKSNFNFDNLAASDYYGAAKYLAEQRHRTLWGLNIVDLRVFSYFSKRQNLNSKLFLPQLILAIKNNEEFFTSDEEMFRDYIGPEELYNLMECVINSSEINISFDCFTCSPISKLALLEVLTNKFGLKALISKAEVKTINPKFWYYSVNTRATSINYFPTSDSLETICRGVVV